jgi:hypothetical protein
MEFADHIVLSSRDKVNYIRENLVSNSDCTLQLQSPVKNFLRAELINFTTSNTYWNVITATDNASFLEQELFYVNNNAIYINSGIYDLNSYLNAIILACSSIPGFNIVFDKIIGRIIISSTSSITFVCGNTKTALHIGALNYGVTYTGTNIILPNPPSISPLSIFIELDILTASTSISTSESGSITESAFNLVGDYRLRSSTFALMNNKNKFENVTFYENSNFSHRIYSDAPITNTIRVRILDVSNNPLPNLGDWIMVIRFVRTPYQDDDFNHIRTSFSSPNVIL